GCCRAKRDSPKRVACPTPWWPSCGVAARSRVRASRHSPERAALRVARPSIPVMSFATRRCSRSYETLFRCISTHRSTTPRRRAMPSRCASSAPTKSCGTAASGGRRAKDTFRKTCAASVRRSRMLDHAPSLSAADAERIARDHYGVNGRALPLTSERDQNFLIEGGDGRRLVLKIANALEDRAMLDAQQRALDHLASRGAPTPSVIPTVNGVELTTITTAHREHAIWAVSVLPGRPMSSMANRPQEFHFDLGRVVGSLGDALETFDHPAAHREFYWDVARARAIVEEHQHLVADEALRRTLAKLTGEFDTRTRPLLDHLPLGVVHGDLNDNNILIARDNAACAARVSGIVDFGDMVYTYRIADLAIAIAYAILGSDDPLTVAAHVVRGFSSVRPPSDDDLSTLFGLVCIRLCASVCIAADQQRRRPDNAYLGVSQTAIGAMLPLLARIPFRLAGCVFRDAAGRDPLRASSAVVQYLKRATFAPVLGIDLRAEPTIVLDLGIASPMLSGNVGENNEPS